MKKINKRIIIFSLMFMLILLLTFFPFAESKSTILENNIGLFDGDTDGITSTRLGSIEISDFVGGITLDDNVLEYDFSVFNETIRIDINAVPKDKDAKVKIEGNEYLKSVNGVITITVSNGIEEDSIYHINWDRNNENYITNPTLYNTAGRYVYTAPYGGYFKLETWGAQGGSSTSRYYGGYGAYSTGVVKLAKGAILYAFVGGQGNVCGTSGCTASGGYNGGGNVRNYDSTGCYGAAGGGASHISTRDSVLSGLSNYRNTVLIVSGAGGGGTYINGSNCGIGGHGGGANGTGSDSTGASDAYINGYGLGASQTAGGCRVTGGRCGGFGYGYGETSSTHGSANSGGGGGGWFGGGGGMVNSGGGGSGYIGNSLLLSYKDVTKHMAGYLNTVNNTASTKTISSLGVSSTPTSDYAKSGSGAIKISAITPVSNNYYLKNITSNIGTWKTAFKPDNFEPFVSVGVYNGSITLDAVTDDPDAEVIGLGKHSLQLGYNYVDLTVTAPNGDVKVYHVTVLRENMKGKHSSEIYRIINNNTGDYIYTEESIVSYDINIYKHQFSADLDIYTFDTDATYEIVGNSLLQDGDVIKIIVNAPNVASTVYLLNVHKILMDSDDMSYTGKYQEWICPETGRYKIELWGAQGGFSYYQLDATSGAEARGGFGAYTSGDILLTKGDKLYFYVGEKGKHGVYRQRVGAAWNGGGYGGLNYQGAGGGGGATDVRLVPASTTDKTAFNNTNSFISRIMVAAG